MAVQYGLVRSMISRRFQAIVLAVVFGGCAPEKPADTSSAAVACGPADQSATFMTPIQKGATLQVTVDSRFSSDEKNAILSAIDVWNQYGRANLGHDLFNPSTSAVAESESPQRAGDCSFSGDPNGLPVFRETSDIKWTALKLSKNNPAVTIRCSGASAGAASGAAVLATQTMLINPNYTQKEELLSIVVHELGHSLGLDHSCTSGAATLGFPACASRPVDHPYNQAVMSPVLHPNTINVNLTEKKENLRSNDTERASCRLN